MVDFHEGRIVIITKTTRQFDIYQKPSWSNSLGKQGCGVSKNLTMDNIRAMLTEDELNESVARNVRHEAAHEKRTKTRAA